MLRAESRKNFNRVIYTEGKIMYTEFYKDRPLIQNEYEEADWNTSSGLEPHTIDRINYCLASIGDLSCQCCL